MEKFYNFIINIHEFEIMEKIRIYNTGYSLLVDNFYEILKEISEIRPHSTFTKDQEEEFLKDAIVIFDYLKSGIDIESSEIFINNGEIPYSSLEKILIKFSKNQGKDDSKAFTFNIYLNNEGNPVKIYEFQNNEEKDLTWNSNTRLERTFLGMNRNILFIKSDSPAKRDYITRPQLKKLIDFALKNDIILLYDATSSKESKGTEKVKSIYEIENAKKVAIEFKRFSSVDNDKITCGYLVVPECLRFQVKNYKEFNFCKIKELLQEEMQKGNISRKSLEKSFLNYVCL